MEAKHGTFAVKKGLAQMLKGGVIMDVVNVEQAKIAEEAGACAVMALERVPADIRAQGGVARMSDPELICAIKKAVSIPVMAKCRIGHFVEAQILEAIGIDYIDESEVLTPADEENHILKSEFKVPFVCGSRNLGEALRRIGEGAAMIRTKGEAGTGDVVEAVRHARTVMGQIRRVQAMPVEELMAYAKEIGAPYELVRETHDLGRLPVVNFAAGGVATPADAALMMQLGMDGVFVGSGIFKSGDPAKRAAAIVKAVTHYKDAAILAEVSKNLGEAMVGINCSSLPKSDKIAERGWGEGAARFDEARAFVEDALRTRLPAGLHFHCAGHTLEDVLPAAETLGRSEGFSSNEQLCLRTAALFHDVGYAERYENNEDVGARWAGEHLPRFGYGAEQVALVRELVMATRMPQRPRGPLQGAMCDADLSHLGSQAFAERTERLRREVSEHSGAEVSAEQWARGNLKFLAEHRWWTASAQRLWSQGQERNLDAVRSSLSGLPANS
eukprot:m51a1_g7588 putative pyridoxal biosynthesis lyase (500) ;mRNA; f:208502-210395